MESRQKQQSDRNGSNWAKMCALEKVEEVTCQLSRAEKRIETGAKKPSPPRVVSVNSSVRLFYLLTLVSLEAASHITSLLFRSGENGECWRNY